MTKVKSAAFGGRKSPGQILADIYGDVQDADVCVITFRAKDGRIYTSWSDGLLTERIGLVEIAKAAMMDAMYEDND